MKKFSTRLCLAFFMGLQYNVSNLKQRKVLYMCKNKRLCALVLLMALLLGLFAGCGKEPEVPNKDADVPVNTAPTVTLDGLPEDQRLQSLVDRAPGDGTTKEYTVMVYIVGSDLESNAEVGCASLDMTEMMDSGLDTSRVNLVVYTGGSRYWHNGVPSDCNALYQMVPGGGLEMVTYTESPSNMGDPNTFYDFLSFTYKNYPANHYGLICWDHGGGSLNGYGFDELFGHDSLLLPEMEAAFDASPFASKKLDFLGFDACLMATLEVAEMADSYANYLIASQENEPGCGWNYSFLQTLNSTSDTKTIAKSILSSYEDGMSIYKRAPKYTLSAVDLSKMSTLRSAADKLYSKMAEGVKGGSYSAIAQARNKTLRFAQTAENPFDIVDMGSMAKNLQSLYGSEAQSLQSALGQIVTQQVSNIDGTCGLAVYYPYDSKVTYTNLGQYLCPDLTDSTGYGAFIAAFTDYWINGEPAVNFTEHEVTEPAPTAPTEPPATEPPATEPAAPAAPQFNGASVQLSADQLANLSQVTYTVFRADTDASSGQPVYIPVLENIPLTPDSSGNVSLPNDQKLIVLKTDEVSEGILWPSRQLDEVTYLSIDGYLTTGMDTAGSQRIAIGFTTGNTSRMNILTLQNLGNAESASRSEPELENWECIANRYVTLFPTCDNGGKLTAYTSWDDSGDEYYQILTYSEDFWLEQVPMNGLQEKFYAQIVITDTQGNSYGSAVTEIYNGNNYSEYTQDGVVYHIYNDHAQVADYTGAGGEVRIAAQVSGKQVTAIAPEAFYYNRDITSVILPEGVETVGSYAFANCKNLTSVLFLGNVKTICTEAFAKSGLTNIYLPEGLERIEAQAFAGTPMGAVNIPASVSYLGAGVFADCKSTVGFTVKGDPNGTSSYFKAVNGILLTADGKELVQAPLGASIRLAIPEGVETIRSGAVRGSETLQEVTFPASLQHIGSYAFYDTVNLTSLTLPDSLETIGHSAFGQFGVSVNTASPIKTVTIGPNLRHIGYDAFDAFPIGVFVVDGGNEYYRAKNNCLLNQSGTVLVHAPYTATGKLEIPQGVSHLAFHSLSMCDGITELVLADSVVSMDAHVGLPDSLKKLTVGRGLARWDNISDAYYLDSVVIRNENPHFVLHDGCVYSRDLTTLYATLNKAAKLHVADTVTTVEDTAFAPRTGYNETLTTIDLPATVTYLEGEMFLNCRALEAVNVHEDNPNYLSAEGMVYTKNGVSLILCPQAKTGTVSVRVGTSTIWRYAFYGQQQASRIVIPEGVKTIRKGNFVSYRKDILDLQLPSTLEKIYPDMFRSPEGYSVTCPAGSAADAFARSRGTQVSN